MDPAAEDITAVKIIGKSSAGIKASTVDFITSESSTKNEDCTIVEFSSIDEDSATHKASTRDDSVMKSCTPE